MHTGKGGPHHPGSEEEGGGDEAGGADEGGEESAVDGLPPGTWLGQERPMSRPVKQHVDILTLSKIRCRNEDFRNFISVVHLLSVE